MIFNLFKKKPHAGEIFAPKGLALRGYDVVEYFNNQKKKGLKDISYQWKNVEWRFSSQKNLDKFKENPQAFEPQFGGYCAFGMSFDYAAKTEPDCFTLYKERLYLNYAKKYQKQWRAAKEERISLAEKNWPRVKEELLKQQSLLLNK